jgi:hypothetical protein
LRQSRQQRRSDQKDLAVTVFGLNPGAQVIVLQGLSTYAALASAYFFARPALLGQPVQSHRDVLTNLRSSDPGITKLIADTSSILSAKAQSLNPKIKAHNRLGIAALVVSLILFTGAVVLQVSDPSFTGQTAAGPSGAPAVQNQPNGQ